MANPTENTTAETGQPPAKMPFPPFDSSTFPSQLVWFAIIFGAMYYYLSRRYLPAVGKLIDTRRARIAKDIDEASALHAEAQAEGVEQDKAIAKAAPTDRRPRRRRATRSPPKPTNAARRWRSTSTPSWRKLRSGSPPTARRR